MRVVVDTNVLASGVFWTGAPRQVIAECLTGNHCWLVTAAVLDEYGRVLARLGWPTEAGMAVAREWTRIVIERGVRVTPAKNHPRCRDAGDDKFIAAAIGGGAELLISGDRDLLEMNFVGTIPVVTPRDGLRRMRNG